MWPKVLELINFYHNSLSSKNQAIYLNKIGNDTLYDFAVHTLEKPQVYARYYTRSEIREIFAFVREAYYPLFQDFYECNVMSLEEEGLLRLVKKSKTKVTKIMKKLRKPLNLLFLL